MDALTFYVEVVAKLSEEGEWDVKFVHLSHQPKNLYTNQIGIAAHKWEAEVVNNLRYVKNYTHILVIHLCWTPDLFKDKATVAKISKGFCVRVREYISNDESWQERLKKMFPTSDWEFHEYYSLD